MSRVISNLMHHTKMLIVTTSVSAVTAFVCIHTASSWFGPHEHDEHCLADQMEPLYSAVESYHIFRGEWPDRLSQLADPPRGMAPILEEVPLDFWGNEYRYSFVHSQESPVIWSVGPDGEACTTDDLHANESPTRPQPSPRELCPAGVRISPNLPAPAAALFKHMTARPPVVLGL